MIQEYESLDWRPAATAPTDGRAIRIQVRGRRGEITTRKASWSKRFRGWRDIYGAGVTFDLWTDYVSPKDRREAAPRGG